MKRLNCAIYTRKSTEEGLDQAFNSLEAQREACVSYVESQRHEGWSALPTLYDDGGYSGGNIERPAMKQLLVDITDGKIDVVVVYKVDRLTRSLADFAKIVEQFDAKGVSFVSVTQQFNTTSSMGRLTLNVLLSFAQFEREVTGERIRDKIAASKKKGMWMGGCLPYGYGVKDRLLYIIPEQAGHVRYIFSHYLEHGSVDQLLVDLDLQQVYRADGKPFSRAALYKLLQNSIYVGKIHHQGELFLGQHEALLPNDIFSAVQQKLATNRTALGAKSAVPLLLTGKLVTDRDVLLVASTTKRRDRRYGYYKTPRLVRPRLSIAAGELEGIVLELLDRHIDDKQDPYFDAVWPDLTPQQKIDRTIKRVVIEPHRIRVELQGGYKDVLTTDYMFYKAGPFSGLKSSATKDLKQEARNCVLLECLLQGFVWRRQVMKDGLAVNEIARREKIDRRYVAQMIYATFLSPKIISQILNGEAKPGLTRRSLLADQSYIWSQWQGYRPDMAFSEPNY